jgi:hypothetical protein
MKHGIQRGLAVLAGGLLILGSRGAFGLGADHPNDRPVSGSSDWPKGLASLVNTTNRVHGFFVNAEDFFFFTGDAARLSTFLSEIARLEGVVSRKLILHEGVGEARSPWDKSARGTCGWKLSTCPKSWRDLGEAARQGTKQGTKAVQALQRAEKAPGYLVEVQVWTGGKLKWADVIVPGGIAVERAPEPLQR